jgi:MFS family permease
MAAVFLVGAATGGVLFGWLGDRIGRVRSMTLSVLTYTIFMGLCGFSASVESVFALRFIASLGMGGEWSLGVALVMETWPNRSRAFLAGLIGAASNVGFLAVAIVGLALSRIMDRVPEMLQAMGLSQDFANFLVLDSNNQPTGWRLMFLIGALPALLTFFIRIMVPESERWLESKNRGATSYWSTADMLGVVVGAAGALSIIYLWANPISMVWRLAGSGGGFAIALAGFTFPVIRYLQRAERTRSTDAWWPTLKNMILGACLSGVALIGTWASIQQMPSWADSLVEAELKKQNTTPAVISSERARARSTTQIASAVGAIVGTIGAAMLGNAIGRRPAYVVMCVTSLFSALAFFKLNQSYGTQFVLMAFVAGGFTASFYGWLPLYLPELFRTQVRATGQGFSFYFGRILAAIGALQFGFLMKEVFKDDFGSGCSIMSLVYITGLMFIWLVPETKGKPLPD